MLWAMASEVHPGMLVDCIQREPYGRLLVLKDSLPVSRHDFLKASDLVANVQEWIQARAWGLDLCDGQ